MLNWIVWNRTVYVWKWIWHEITYNGWCAIKPNQTSKNDSCILLIRFASQSWDWRGTWQFTRIHFWMQIQWLFWMIQTIFALYSLNLVTQQPVLSHPQGKWVTKPLGNYYLSIYWTSLAQAGCDPWSIFQWSLTGLNSVFLLDCLLY